MFKYLTGNILCFMNEKGERERNNKREREINIIEREIKKKTERIMQENSLSDIHYPDLENSINNNNNNTGVLNR